MMRSLWRKSIFRHAARNRLTRGLIITAIAGGWVIAPTAAGSSPLRVGAAKLDLTPPVKTPLAGYSRRKGRLASGIHDAPSVRALVMRAGATTVALVSCDLLIIDEALFEEVQRRLRAEASLPPMTLLLAATHTHSGPGAYGKKLFEKISMGYFNPVVWEFLADRITAAVAEAYGRAAPATARAATASGEGLVVNRMIPEGVVDSDIRVLVFDDASAQPLALVANFSAHPTTLGAWNRQMSADYPGVLARAVESRYPSAACLFTAGSVGDQAPVKEGSGFERASWLGNALVGRLLESLEHPTTISTAHLAASQRTVRLDPARLRLGGLTLPSWISQPFVDDDATLTVIAAGQALFLGVPCDLSAELGLELQRYAASKGYHPFVVGFANDYIGYCVPERLYQRRQYETSMAFNGPHTGRQVVDELRRMIDDLSETVAR